MNRASEEARRAHKEDVAKRYKARQTELLRPLQQRTDLSQEAIDTLYIDLDPLSPSTLHHLTRLLDHSLSDVRSAAATVLRMRKIPDTDLDWLISRLPTTKDSSKTRNMIEALGFSLPSIAIQAPMQTLNHKDKNVAAAAEEALRRQDSLSVPDLKTLLLKGKHEDSKRFAAAELVRHRAESSPGIMGFVLSQVETMGGEYTLFKKRTDLPQHIGLALEKRIIRVPKMSYPMGLMILLANQQTLPPDVLQIFAGELREDTRLVTWIFGSHLDAGLVAALRKKYFQFFSAIYQIALDFSFSQPVAWSFNDH